MARQARWKLIPYQVPSILRNNATEALWQELATALPGVVGYWAQQVLIATSFGLITLVRSSTSHTVTNSPSS